MGVDDVDLLRRNRRLRRGSGLGGRKGGGCAGWAVHPRLQRTGPLAPVGLRRLRRRGRRGRTLSLSPRGRDEQEEGDGAGCDRKFHNEKNALIRARWLAASCGDRVTKAERLRNHRNLGPEWAFGLIQIKLLRCPDLVPNGQPLLCSPVTAWGIHAFVHEDSCPRCGWVARSARACRRGRVRAHEAA